VGRKPTFFIENTEMIHLNESFESLIQETLKIDGFDLVDLDIKRNPSSVVIKCFIDRYGGITIDDCVYVNRVLSTVLEQECNRLGITLNRFDVSSPGIERPLKTVKDFQRNIGREVSILFSCDGEKNRIIGSITGVVEESIQVQSEIDSFNVPVSSVIQAHIKTKW